MTKFHIHPETGDVLKCSAKSPESCRFASGDDIPQHFDTVEDGRRFYEKSQRMSGNIFPNEQYFSMDLTPATQKVVDKLVNAGITPVLVGGCVRDKFLGMDSKDVDIELYGAASNGKSLNYGDISKLFSRKEGFRVDETGVSFSVLKVRYGKEDFDISLPRNEKSTGAGHKEYDVEHDSTMSFAEASSRRDFTINSMGFNPVKGELVDPHNGAEDLKNRILRHVGPAFSDDPLRCMRAVNFAARFDMKLAPETQDLCKKLSDDYDSLARERIEEEFNKVFYKGSAIGNGLTVLHDIGWAQKMPSFKTCTRGELKNYGDVLNNIDIPLRKAALSFMMQRDGHGNPMNFLDASTVNRNFEKSLNGFVGSTMTIGSTVSTGEKSFSYGKMVAAHRELKQRFPDIKNADIEKYMKVLNVRNDALKYLPENPVPTVVTGQKLLEKGFKPGPEMGRIIKKAQSIQDNGGEYDFDTLLNISISSVS